MITTELQHLECQRSFSDRLQRGDAFEVSVVFTQDVPRVGNAEIVAVLLRPLLHNRPELVKLVARHRGEEVVNELSVHSSPEPSLERVLHVCLARASKLHIHKGPVLVHDFLALVVGALAVVQKIATEAAASHSSATSNSAVEDAAEVLRSTEMLGGLLTASVQAHS